MNRTLAIVLIVIAAVLGPVLGYIVRARMGKPHTAAGAAAQKEVWTCPMHPEIRLPEQTPCPKCGMDLVKADDDGEQDDGPTLEMSDTAIELARIRTARVERKQVTLSVRLVGKVDYDETRVRTIAARIPGRLERLFVDYAGIKVQRGDHLVRLYSPVLLTAQQELIEAKGRVENTAEGASSFLADSNRRGYQAAREKLALWGLTDQQIDSIESRGDAEDTMLIRSPSSGVVIEKQRREGEYVQEGSPIYRVADLHKLWILLDAYEQDLPWIRFGQQVDVTTEALPGDVFRGKVSFVAPMVDPMTRTVRVRVNIDNSDGRLKPGMFVRAVIRSRIAEEGAVVDASLEGKWISPMHPEIVKDAPGVCDVCGMDLVPAEQLGYASIAAVEAPIVVPASAVLVTGTRAVVYVRMPDQKKPTFEGREIVLGPRADDLFVVRSGLEPGEEVVVNGAFRIDSSMQILAKPSMMSMPGGDVDSTPETKPRPATDEPADHSQHEHGDDTTSLPQDLVERAYAAYLQAHRGLAADDLATGSSAIASLRTVAGEVLDVLGDDPAARVWQRLHDNAKSGFALTDYRERFASISRGIIAIHDRHGHRGSTPLYRMHCPMALDNKGADWLQSSPDLTNPYFGASMLGCGTLEQTYEPLGDGR